MHTITLLGFIPLSQMASDFSDMLRPIIKERHVIFFFINNFQKTKFIFSWVIFFFLLSHRNASKENTPPFSCWWDIALNTPSLLDQIRWGSWALKSHLHQCIGNIFLLQFCNHNYAIYKNPFTSFSGLIHREIFTRWCPGGTIYF